jgi:hypothetical protein
VRLESAIESKLPEGVKLVSVSRLRGGGFEVEVESEKAVKEGLASEIAETIEEIEGGKESVKLRTELIQRSQSGE